MKDTLKELFKLQSEMVLCKNMPEYGTSSEKAEYQCREWAHKIRLIIEIIKGE